MPFSSNKFSDLYDTFLSLKSPYLAPGSVTAMRATKKAFLKLVPDKTATEFTGIDILQFVRLSLDKGRKPNGVNVELRNLKTFGNWCAKQKLLERDNAFNELEMLKVRAKAIRFLTRDEFQKIYNLEKKPLLRHIYLVALVTGQRCSDVISLRWEMLDMKRAVIRLVNKKTNRLNTIPMHPMLFDVLNELGMKAAGPLFQGRYGEKLTVGYISHAFRRTAKKAGIDDVSFHTLRKTFASWLALSGVGLHEIQKLLGHSSVLLTEKYYASLCSSELHGTVAKLMPVTGSVPNIISGPEPRTMFLVDQKVQTLKF